MVSSTDIESLLNKYDSSDLRVATIGSHSALNILKGAKEEGFRTLCICEKSRERLYKHFPVADELILVDSLEEILDDGMQEKLRERNAVVVPHGSFNAYLDSKIVEGKFHVPVFGNRSLLRWESSRDLQREWLKKAGLKVPYLYKKPSDIDTLVLVKFPGAKGGRGYFIADSEEAYHRKMSEMIAAGLTSEEESKKSHIQEYIIGVSVYPHYFYSPLKQEIELLSIDKRYESSVDGISRIPAPEQLGRKLNPSFTIIGNFPMVVRESLLPELFDVGEKLAEVSKEIAPPGTIGPFCLETICRENMEVVAFEISARIVAGCNVAVPNSLYSYILYDEPMYMGKRIARELKLAAQQDKLKDVVT